MDKILTYFKVRRCDVQRDKAFTSYFSPWHKGERLLRVSKGKHLGGLYATPLWEVVDGRASQRGYGAISLTAKLLGVPNDSVNLQKVVRTIVDICEMRLPWVEPHYINGVTEYVNAQSNVSLTLEESFSVEGLLALGMNVERTYVVGDNDTTTPKEEDGEPVFLCGYGNAREKASIVVERLHRELCLYEVKEYITKQFWKDKLQVSRHRKATPLFPIFAFKHISYDKSKTAFTWHEVYQPEWRGAEDVGCENSHFTCFDNPSDFRKLSEPLEGDEVCRLMMYKGETATKAVLEAGTSTEVLITSHRVEIYDDGKKETKDVPYQPDEIKLTNVVLCGDGLNAVATYFALNTIKTSYIYNGAYENVFYHVVWYASEKQKSNGYAMKLLRDISCNKFIICDCDMPGKQEGFRLCKRNNSIRMATLPDRLMEFYNVYRAGQLRQATDVRAFFTAYRMTEEEGMSFDNDLRLLFLSLFTSALPIEPLVYTPSYDKKTGELKDYTYRVDSACLWMFMSTEGFAREVDRNSTNIIGRYIHMDGCFVKELDSRSIIAATQEALIGYAQRVARPGTEDFRKMKNAVITSRDILECKASNLPTMDVDYRSGYGAKVDHFFYRNGALRITPDEIVFVSYSKINFCVDKAEIMPFDFKMPCARGEEPFSISENPEYEERIKTLEAHRRDTEHFSQIQLQQEERDLQVWSQMHRWLFDFKGKKVEDWWQPLQVLRCFANEEYEQEQELLRGGKEFSDDQKRALEARMANILYSLGRPLFRYRGGGTNYMPYITESRNSVNDRAEGGSGKSLFVNIFMGCSGKIYRVNSRNLRPDSDIALFLDQFQPHCYRVIHWEDWPSGMKIDPLYNYVTSGFEFRQRHKDTIRVPLNESPGHVITSNFQQTYEDPSSSGRVVPTGFSHRFNRGDVRKNKPQQRVSDVMPGVRDNAEDMSIELRSQIAYINAMAVQFCMRTSDRVLPPMEALNERSQKRAMGDTFIQWAKEFFSHDYNFRCPIDLKTIFQEYVELCDTSDDKKNKFSVATFRNKVLEYCSDNGYVCNPDVCLTSNTEKARKYMRVKAWCKRTYFSDEAVWGPGKKKEIRELAQSQQCMFFIPSEEEAKSLTRDMLNEQLKKFYEADDPAPCIDPETNKPYTLSEEELANWNIYMLKKQGNYAKANEISNNQKGAAAGTLAPDIKKGEVEELPF
jgi:hypothetical protein